MCRTVLQGHAATWPHRTNQRFEGCSCDTFDNCSRRAGLFILQIEYISLAVDDLSVLRNRRVNAGATLGIDEFDGLGHRVGMFAAVIQRLEPKSRCRPGAGLAGFFPRPAPEIDE
jgi:hypothetical protein